MMMIRLVVMVMLVMVVLVMMMLVVMVGTDDGEVSVNHMHDTIGEMRGHRLA